MLKQLKAVVAAITMTTFASCITIQNTPAQDVHNPKESGLIQHAGGGVITFSGAVGRGSAEDFRRALDEARDEPRIVIRLDTPGGFVHEGRQIAAAIMAAGLTKEVSCHVYGRAASMGFFILQTCPIRTMAFNAALMVHRAAFQVGSINAVEALDAALHLETVDAELASVQCARLNISMEMCRGLYDTQDFWMGADVALNLGAVDRITL